MRVLTRFVQKYTLRLAQLELGGVDLDLAVEDVGEEPRQPFAAGGIESTQPQVLADAPLMFGDRLLSAGVWVDRLGVGSQLQGGEPEDLPVNLQGRLLGESAEHTHEGNW